MYSFNINKMSCTQFLPLPESPNSYEELKEAKSYFVDKTPFIKTVFTDSASVLLFTRPRRFGKTLLMTMFDAFLRIDKDRPFDTTISQKYFKDTKILEDKEFCSKFMGQYPVIDITLKDVDGDFFEPAYRNFAQTVSRFSSKYKYLLKSPKLDLSDKDRLKKISDEGFLRQLENSDYLTGSLRTLANILYKEYGKYPILLIDEYDVPLANASYHDIQNAKLYRNDQSFIADYHTRMVTLMKGFLGILKDKNTLTKTVITGCLKVAKNDIFTGVNNFTVNTVVDKESKYTDIIGFIEDETNKFLKDYGMEDLSQLVKENYDGYKFYDKDIFCPWDVVKFIRKNFEFKQKDQLSEIEAGNYWSGSSSSTAIYEYLGYLTDNDNQKMQDLVDGKSISFVLNESMNYDCLSQHNANDFWSLLLHTGYLTLDWQKTKKEELSKDNATNKEVFVRIPNLEILTCFTDNIKSRFDDEIAPQNVADALANTLFEGKEEQASDTIYNLLQNYISIRDNATKALKENYYHGFLNGLFSNCSKNFFSEYHSNYESGDGYADIVFKSRRNDKVVIIEIKSCRGTESKKAKAREALAQIEEKKYATAYLNNEDVNSIYACGISFSKKDCAVICKKIK